MTAAPWVTVARVGDIAPNEFKVVEIDGTMIALFNVNGGYHAIDDLCTHDGASLAGGAVEGNEVICPRHGARFCIRTGTVTAPPALEPVHVFPVRVRDGSIEVRDDRWD